jgi:putative transposase
MNNDNLIAFQAPESSESFNDALTQLVRQGARQIIAQAVEAELKEFLAQYQSLKDDQGRQAIVRNGYLPERTIMTGVGEVEIQVPKIRDRSGSGIKFNSSLLPLYLKRSQSVEEVLPWLYLKGVSTGDFADSWLALRGQDAGPLLYPVRRVGQLIRRHLSDQTVLRVLQKRATQAGIPPCPRVIYGGRLSPSC